MMGRPAQRIQLKNSITLRKSETKQKKSQLISW